ncbi:MAG: murein biosynthesis integral membrane protein MurJ [Desulfobacterales bacterium]|nr:murein biosynthesis integral membrane protein MurJ [Desulfobacterales bacterium]
MALHIYKKVGIATFMMMASIFLSRVIGLGREITIAYIGGTQTSVDAYQVSFIIPELLNHMVASGFLSVTFIPIFSHYLAINEEEKGWQVFSTILMNFSLLLVVLMSITLYYTPVLVNYFAPGFSDPLAKQLAIRMTRIIIPAQFFFFAGGLFMAVQYAKEQFAFPAFAPLIYNIGIIIFGVILSPWIGMEGFSWGVLIGAFVGNFLLQYMGARRMGMHLYFTLNFNHPDFKTYIRQTIPLMFGLTMTFSTEIFFKWFGTYLPAGSISSLNYGLRVMLMLVGFFGQAVGVASFPFMARLSAENRIQEMNELLNKAVKYLLLILPVSVLMMVLRHETIYILFQRGKFDAVATEQTAGVFFYLLIGAFAFAAQTVVGRGFYAMQNTLLPTIISTFTAIVSIPMYYLGMQQMGANGIALAVSLSSIFQVGLLYAIWNQRSQNDAAKQIYYFLFKLSFVSLSIGALLYGTKLMLKHYIDASTLLGNLWMILTLSVFFGFLLIIMSRILQLNEILIPIHAILKKMKKILKKNK